MHVQKLAYLLICESITRLMKKVKKGAMYILSIFSQTMVLFSLALLCGDSTFEHFRYKKGLRKLPRNNHSRLLLPGTHRKSFEFYLKYSRNDPVFKPFLMLKHTFVIQEFESSDIQSEFSRYRFIKCFYFSFSQ